VPVSQLDNDGLSAKGNRAAQRQQQASCGVFAVYYVFNSCMPSYLLPQGPFFLKN
jgi:hypothetical protein